MGVGRAAEAKPLLRRQLTILSDKKVRKKTPAKAISLTHALRVQLGMTFAALPRLLESEAILLESVPKLPARSAKRRARFGFSWTPTCSGIERSQIPRAPTGPPNGASASPRRQQPARTSHERRHVARAHGVLEPSDGPRELVLSRFVSTSVYVCTPTAGSVPSAASSLSR